MSWPGYKSIVILFPLAGLIFGLVVLGFWQLDRASEKQELIRVIELRQHQDAIRLDGRAGKLDGLRFRNVLVTGHFDPDHQFLLDNQVMNGKAGVHVLSPFHITDSSVSLLVNRGWVQWDSRRNIGVDLGITDSTLTLQGRVNSFPGVGFRLEGAEIPGAGWPALVQIVDVETLSEVLGYPLLPFQVLLNPESAEGFVRKWRMTVPVSPDKHFAYAVQWFAMAAVLLMLALYRWVRGNE